MSTTRTIGPLTRKPLRPTKQVVETEHKLLENPSSDDLKLFTRQGWRIAFETYAIAVRPSGGTTKVHFVRMEKQTKVSIPLFGL